MNESSLFEEGREAFNKTDFFQAHELWEKLWQDLKLIDKQKQQRLALQALIQITVALHLIKENRLIGAKKVLERARLNIEKSNDFINDINLSSLYQEIISFLANSDLDNCLNVKI